MTATPGPLTIATERYLDNGGSPDYLIGVLRRAIEIRWTAEDVAELVDTLNTERMPARPASEESASVS